MAGKYERYFSIIKIDDFLSPGYLQQNETLMTSSLQQKFRCLKIRDSQLVTRLITVKFVNDVGNILSSR